MFSHGKNIRVFKVKLYVYLCGPPTVKEIIFPDLNLEKELEKDSTRLRVHFPKHPKCSEWKVQF